LAGFVFLKKKKKKKKGVGRGKTLKVLKKKKGHIKQILPFCMPVAA